MLLILESSSFMLRCKTFSKSNAWNALEIQETLCILVLKLPGSLRGRWNRKVQVVRRNFGWESRLSDFTSCVHEETTLVNDPIFSKHARVCSDSWKEIQQTKEIWNLCHKRGRSG